MHPTPLEKMPPADDYDAESWRRYYEMNPGVRRAAGADAAQAADGGESGTSGDGGEGSSRDQGGGDAGGAAPPDFSFVPEQFLKDGKPDGKAFRERFDELAAFEATTNEARSELPAKPEDYAFDIPDDFELPEGIELKIDPEDPDLPVLRSWAHENAVPQKAMNELAKIFAGRELRAQTGAMEEFNKEFAALGKDAQSRIDTIKRSLTARLPADQADALMGATFTAPAVKALEKLLSGPGGRATTPAATPDLDKMSPREMLAFANKQAEQRRKAG